MGTDKTAVLRALAASLRAGASFDQCLALMDALSVEPVVPPASGEPAVDMTPAAA